MPFDLIVHSFEPRMEGRMGRIIGRAWDMMAALVEGPVSQRDILITGEEIHKLYAGRATPGTLIWALPEIVRAPAAVWLRTYTEPLVSGSVMVSVPVPLLPKKFPWAA